MRWIKRKLYNWVNNNDDLIQLDNYHAIRTPDEPDAECIRFKVFRANGGTIVQTENYNQKTDRHNHTLHVIVEGQDLGQELSKIITFESLKL
jgi:hypothetical protein